MRVAVIGGGPAGLMAAEAAAAHGASVHVFEHKTSVGRKLLVAGKSGLNLTHAEPLERFLDRYGEARARLEPFVRAFPPEALRRFAAELGQETFVGSSGRVFPTVMKANELLAAWTARLTRAGVSFHLTRAWSGWAPNGKVSFACAQAGEELFAADACVLALGGASWPETGSDGAWTRILEAHGIELRPFEPANAGWRVELPAGLGEKLEGAPVKSIALRIGEESARGDLVVMKDGIEGTPVYRLGAAVRRALTTGPVVAELDVKPDVDAPAVAKRLASGGTKSLSNRIRALKLDPAARTLASALLAGTPRDPDALARALKALPLRVTGLRPLAEAISSAGGVRWSEIDEVLMLHKRPGVFVAGEMIDWEAPTGGYLLQACFSTGRAAGEAAARWAAARPR